MTFSPHDRATAPTTHRPTPAVPATGGWCANARPDPITGLVAFPDFDAEFPARLAASLRLGQPIGLAIGDVDHLKEYVETANATDPMSFGHLAGNALMARLGQVTAGWFDAQRFTRGCASTFGGDEVIIAVQTDGLHGFHASIRQLAAQLADDLPRTVSFAVAVLTPDEIPAVVPGPGWDRHLYVHLIAAVDRCLFAAKATRGPRARRGFVTMAALPSVPPLRRRMS